MRESENIQDPFNSSKPKNRAAEIALPKAENFSITLYDVDLAMMEYMRDVVLPELEEDKKKIKVPVLKIPKKIPLKSRSNISLSLGYFQIFIS